MEIIKAKRFLVRSLFDGERTCQLRLVDLTGELLQVVPFERETPATVFIDARVVLFDRDIIEADAIHDMVNRLSYATPSSVGSAEVGHLVARPGMTASSSVLAVAY